MNGWLGDRLAIGNKVTTPNLNIVSIYRHQYNLRWWLHIEFENVYNINNRNRVHFRSSYNINLNPYKFLIFYAMACLVVWVCKFLKIGQ